MGYRLTVENLNNEIIMDSKLYGYLEESELKQCKSLQWLIDHHKLDDMNDPYHCWDWNCSAEQIMPRAEFCEFIVLYIIDANRFRFADRPLEYHLRVENFEEAFDQEYVKIGWW